MEPSQAASQSLQILDEVKVLHETHGSSIREIIEPTILLFMPHLLRERENIQTIRRTTQKFGSHSRQQLDVYRPINYAVDGPILLFLPGGGFVHGDRILPFVPEGLIFHNLGTFFATRGFTTIVPDYRRVNSEFGGENAKYPSGGEDLALALKWLEESEFGGNTKRDIFILGESAGGVHLATFLLEPRFLEQRRSLIDGKNGLFWKGAIGLGVPFNFKSADEPFLEVVKEYYGSAEDVEQHSPYGLLHTLVEKGTSRQEAAVPRILAMVNEFDPSDGIVEPVKDFAQLGKQHWGDGVEGILTIEGHNHISAGLSLMSGNEKAEKWGEDLVKWMLNQD